MRKILPIFIFAGVCVTLAACEGGGEETHTYPPTTQSEVSETDIPETGEDLDDIETETETDAPRGPVITWKILTDDIS